MWDTLVRPSAEDAERYLTQGWWRAGTFLDDLARHAADHGDRAAIIGYLDGAIERTVSWSRLATLVERFAGGLRELGVGRGDVVVLYLPNRWMIAPLYLACLRIGAVGSPVIPALGTRELSYILRTSRARVCVTVDAFAGTDYAERLVTASTSAPEGMHRVVVGDAARTGAIGFGPFFEDTPWEQRRPAEPDTAAGPDDPALLLYTSGTTGQMKGVVHSQNTLFAAVRAVSDPLRLGSGDVISIPNFLTHMAGTTYAIFMPLLVGGACVTQDANTDMELLLEIIVRHGVTFVYAAPGYVVNLVAAQRAGRHATPELTHLVSGSAPIDPQLITDVREAFGVGLQALWGMTENGAVTMTRPDDPPGWAAHSDGRAMAWMDVRVDADPGSGVGPLFVRGASQCLGYLGQRELYESCVDGEGWFDTGDLARDDGRGGIRITGRRVDLITRASGQKVSTLEVEALLQRHPAVREAVLVGYPDPRVPGADLICAVVIPDGDAPTLEDLHRLLDSEGMARVLWPDRLQFVRVLPKNSLGKVLRPPLRQRLEMAVAPRS